MTIQQEILTTPDNPEPKAAGASSSLEAWLRHTRRDEHPYLFPAADAPPRTRHDFADASTPDLREDIRLCVERLARLGIEVIVMNATRPDLGISVVRVVAPGLRHFKRQLGPGRLYDVPVALGWRDRPPAEHELNPLTVF